MEVAEPLAMARQAHRRQEWVDACALYGEADRRSPLELDDLELYAEAAHLTGHGDEAIRALQRAYQIHTEAGQVDAAVRDAFWLYQALGLKGEYAQAAGWIARAGRLPVAPEGDPAGYLLVVDAERRATGGDCGGAFDTAARAVQCGNRCGDRDLVALAAHIQGVARIREGRLADGLALLDEVMAGVTAGECTPRITGWIYCSVIAACHEVQELRRAREWTVALNAWCDALPQFTGAYSGICRIHRAELLQLAGAWPDAVREARTACEYLTQGYGEALAGAAFYQLGEVHRLRGEAGEAEQAYRQVSRYGWEVQPGMALLRLAQGRVDAARAGIGRALTEASDRMVRSRMLPAAVEILLVAGDLAAAREAATELAGIADEHDSAALQARAAQARGAIHLADDNPTAALPALRSAWRVWRDLDAPYEAARCRVLLGLACRALGDEESAAMELDAARTVFVALGAAGDLQRAEALMRTRPAAEPSGLSRREIEVLRLLAAGKTNAAIAAEMFLSEKTVARHVSNIFAKLRVNSRTAAAGYAFDHGIR